MARQGHIYFEIQVDEVERAVEFYEAAFGWKFTKVEGLPIEYRLRREARAEGC
jgi:uncharacterized protein